MAFSYQQLRALSDDDLIQQHDSAAGNTFVGISYFLDELRRREQERTNALMLRLTWVTALCSAGAVLISVAALLVSLLASA